MDDDTFDLIDQTIHHFMLIFHEMMPLPTQAPK